jgi:hypothetical protein
MALGEREIQREREKRFCLVEIAVEISELFLMVWEDLLRSPRFALLCSFFFFFYYYIYIYF